MSESSLCCPPRSHALDLNDKSLDADTAEPKGISLTLGSDTPCYYIGPTSPSELGLVVFVDIWGFQSRIKHLCDYIAENGNYHVICVDSFRGETKGDHSDNLLEWLQSVPYDPIVKKDTLLCIDYLRNDKGVVSFGAIGFCWGAWAIGKSSEDKIPFKVGVGIHPSFKVENLIFDGDAVSLMTNISFPLLLLSAENDLDYTKPGSPEVEELFKRGGDCILFSDMKHGWTTRGDLSDNKIKRDVKKALEDTLSFLSRHFNGKNIL